MAEDSKIDPHLDAYLTAVTPKIGDPTYSILKSHLLFEEILRDFLDSQLRYPKALENARLTFAQVLAIAKATSIYIKPDSWRWVAIEKLNKLRNLMAHHMDEETAKTKIKEFTQFVFKAMDYVPEKQENPEKFEPIPPVKGVPIEIYTEIDIALACLYDAVRRLLELDKKAYSTSKIYLTAIAKPLS